MINYLGIPRIDPGSNSPTVDWLPRPSDRFHDTTLGESIRSAYHAMAIDEHRSAYKTTLWTASKPTTEKVKQRWFSGAHADVGGGYPDDLLHSQPELREACFGESCSGLLVVVR